MEKPGATGGMRQRPLGGSEGMLSKWWKWTKTNTQKWIPVLGASKTLYSLTVSQFLMAEIFQVVVCLSQLHVECPFCMNATFQPPHMHLSSFFLLFQPCHIFPFKSQAYQCHSKVIWLYRVRSQGSCGFLTPRHAREGLPHDSAFSRHIRATTPESSLETRCTLCFFRASNLLSSN